MCSTLRKKVKKKTIIPQIYNISLFSPNKDKPDWRLLKDHMLLQGSVSKDVVLKLIEDCNKILSKTKTDKAFFILITIYVNKENEGNLLMLQDPLVVVGDVHGYS